MCILLNSVCRIKRCKQKGRHVLYPHVVFHIFNSKYNTDGSCYHVSTLLHTLFYFTILYNIDLLDLNA